MWRHWAHNGRSLGDKPRLWWRESETTSRAELPLGHLFPRSPRPVGGEAARLVTELARDRQQPDGKLAELEAIVQAYKNVPAKAGWEPVEAWQVVSIHRIDETETTAWGADGALVVEWFDRGDLATWPLGAPPAEPAEAPPRGLSWFRARLAAWFGRPEGLELVTAGS